MWIRKVPTKLSHDDQDFKATVGLYTCIHQLLYSTAIIHGQD